MEGRTDILWDDDGDLAVGGDGDFVVGPSSDQHVQDILIASPGEYKQYPMIGASVIQAKNGFLNGDLKNRIRINLEADGYKLIHINQEESDTPGEMVINIDYEEK